MTTKTRTQNETKTKKRARYIRAAHATDNAAKLERLDYNPADDGTRGGYTYGDDWSGDDLRALCDIFGA